ncbi:hypothetical protein FD04_GL000782 [Secundilactobacillus odoratitofui DSM 19909 = JCM 15043]|uniref:N-acetyltransferase domain-containing protein n=2 Tax=Secundilactobacillus odoratitofui TaxID=480930 RepID=A0A0R1LW19_9LACO|nr:hypothetical protein FD04_GL000782 [Secundilactobacillus odoratitofui DSM 19909 = JCM 15043]
MLWFKDEISLTGFVRKQKYGNLKARLGIHRNGGDMMTAITFEVPKQVTDEMMVLLLSADPDEQMIESYIHRAEIRVAKSADQIVGVICTLTTRPLTVEIVNLAVRDDYQNHGIGAQLINEVIQHCRAEKVTTLAIGTGSTSFGPLYLYQKLGFRMVGVDRDFFVRHYSRPIEENGLVLRDMIRLELNLK